MNPMNPMNWFRKATEKMEDQEAFRGVPDINPGEDTPEPLQKPTQEPANSEGPELDGKIPTRKSLKMELDDAEEQVDRLRKILAQPDAVIHLFLGTERYT